MNLVVGILRINSLALGPDCKHPAILPQFQFKMQSSSDSPPQWLSDALSSLKQELLHELLSQPPPWLKTVIDKQNEETIPDWFNDFLRTEQKRIRRQVISEVCTMIAREYREEFLRNSMNLACSLDKMGKAVERLEEELGVKRAGMVENEELQVESDREDSADEFVVNADLSEAKSKAEPPPVKRPTRFLQIEQRYLNGALDDASEHLISNFNPNPNGSTMSDVLTELRDVFKREVLEEEPPDQDDAHHTTEKAFHQPIPQLSEAEFFRSLFSRISQQNVEECSYEGFT